MRSAEAQQQTLFSGISAFAGRELTTRYLNTGGLGNWTAGQRLSPDIYTRSPWHQQRHQLRNLHAAIRPHQRRRHSHLWGTGRGGCVHLGR